MTQLTFSERMSGWVSFGERDWNQALLAGRRTGTRCGFHLEVDIADFESFRAAPNHPAQASGWVECDELGGRLAVERGTLELFAGATPRRRRMNYRLFLRDGAGRPVTLSGFKELVDDPNYDVWSDTSTLFVRVLTGHPREDPEGDESTIATGVLRLHPLDLARTVASFRSPGAGPRRTAATALRFQRLFAGELRLIYRGSAAVGSHQDFPAPRAGTEPYQGYPPGDWHDLPGRRGLQRRILPFTAEDGRRGTLHNIRGDRAPSRCPVLLVHGTGVRANLFYGAPISTTLVDVLVKRGYDVWVESWRASIDLPPTDYTLDEAAAYDHPAAVREVRRHTGAEKLKAVIHCQGSTSFMMALIAGLVPEVTHVVSNAVSLHVHVPRAAVCKQRVLLPVSRLRLRGMDAQWGARAPSAIALGVARWARVQRKECDNPICALSNFMYGKGPDIVWRHENLDEATHRWLGREFGYVPLSFFSQMGRCIRAGHLVPVDGLPSLPDSFVGQPPRTEARFTFLGGTRNRCFLPQGQRETFEYFDALRPGRHALHLLRGYSHLDPFFGRRSAADVFPLVLAGLERRE